MTYKVKKNKESGVYEVFWIRDKFHKKPVIALPSRAIAVSYIKMLYAGLER